MIILKPQSGPPPAPCSAIDVFGMRGIAFEVVWDACGVTWGAVGMTWGGLGVTWGVLG